MRLAILQSNPKIGGIQQNLRWLQEQIRQHKDQVDLFITPEQALTGYPARDLWAQTPLLEREERALAELVELSRELNVGLLVGHSERRAGFEGKKLYNSASLYDSGHLVGRVRKSRLPSYDIFEEDRHFEAWTGGPQPALEFRGHRLSVFVCEDSWDSIRAFGVRDVRQYPGKVVPTADADLVINLSASPYALGKVAGREDMFSSFAIRHQRPVIYANFAGGQDGILFDGASFALNSEGVICAQASSFAPEVLRVSFEKGQLRALSPSVSRSASDWESLYEALVCGVRDFVSKSGGTKVALGLSGGIDSAFCAALAVDALGAANVLGVSLPSAHTSNLSRDLARESARRLGIAFREIPIQAAVDTHQKLLGLPAQGLGYENLQSRNRGLLLMGIANSEGYFVLATGNKSELALGYTTLYGDLAGALAPLGDLYKTEVYGLSHWLGLRALANQQESPIPAESLSRAPSAELAPGQKDSDSLPEYTVLDGLLFELIENQGQTLRSEKGWNHLLGAKFTVDKIREKIFAQEFKRKQAPPILRVHQRSFGPGWLSPVVLDATLGLVP